MIPEILKDILHPKTYKNYSYAILCFFIVLNTSFIVLIDKRQSDEINTFACADVEIKNKDHIKTACLNQYRKQYNSLPVYTFGIPQLILVGFISIFYSVYAKKRIDKLENLMDVSHQQRQKTSRLFKAYRIQIIAKLLSGATCLILEMHFSTTTDLPLNYDCEYRQLNRSATNGSTATGIVPEKYNCTYQKDGIKTLFIWMLIAVNVIFLASLLFEVVYISNRARREEHFKDDPHFFAVHLQSEDPLGIFIKGLKDRVIKDTKLIKPVFPYYVDEGKIAHDIELDQIHYPKVVLYPEKVNFNYINENRHGLYIEFLKESGLTIEKPEDIFVLEEPGGIFVVGRPGIGKTVFCKKLLLDWASGKRFKRNENGELYFDMAFLFSFRGFKPDGEFSLYELLTQADYSASDCLEHTVISFIRENPSKILLLFDGIDEFSNKRTLIDYNDHHANDENEKMPFPELYRKLASGKLLTGAKVVTTVNSTNFSSFTRLPFKRTVEILEFTPEEVEKCVERITNDVEVKEKLWNCIRNNTMLQSLCCIPAVCLMVCSYFQQLLKFECQIIPRNLAELFTGIFRMLVVRNSFEYHKRNPNLEDFTSDTFSDTLSEKLTRVGEVAYNGISRPEAVKVIFTQQEVLVDMVDGLKETGVLHLLPPNHVCFAHITVQEFLAARYLVKRESENREADLRRFASDHIMEGKWQRVLQFVIGQLQNQKIQVNILRNLLPSLTEMKTLSTKDADAEDSEQNIRICWPFKRHQLLVLTLCKCLLECSELEFVTRKISENISCDVIDLSDCGLRHSDCTAVARVSQHIATRMSVRRIRLTDNFIGPRGCKDIGEILSIQNLTALEIDGNGITDLGVKNLCSELSLSSSNLKKLSLARNKITDEGVKLLARSLEKSNVSHLNLSSNKIGDIGANEFACFLSNNDCKLSHLNLSFNAIRNEGVNALCNKLSGNVEHECKLTYLNLAKIRINSEAIAGLFGTLLTTNCKLSQLNLSRNNITDTIVQDLSERVLSKENCTLIQLNLSENKITDVGVKHLSTTLSETHCALKRLNLSGNNSITHKGVEDLSKVLHKLNQLSLNGIRMTDHLGVNRGVKHLSKAISNGKCKSIQLDLGSSGITKESVMELFSALIRHKDKLGLNLHDNKLTDADVQQLWFVFSIKRSNIKLKLNLSKNKLTDESVHNLYKELRDKRSNILNHLNLSDNNLTDACFETFKKLLTRMPHCQLDLSGNEISEENMHHLKTRRVSYV